MKMSPEELARLASLAEDLIGFGIRIGIDGSMQNPGAPPEFLHAVIMQSIRPQIAARWTSAVMAAQVEGHLESEPEKTP